MGFTLRTVLDVLPSAAFVIVAEFVPAVIQWNREPLAALAGYPLRDPRVRIEVADVGFTLRANPGHFDAILLDVDNGPAAFTVGVNAGLYDNSGVAAAYAARVPEERWRSGLRLRTRSSNNAFASTDSRWKWCGCAPA